LNHLTPERFKKWKEWKAAMHRRTPRILGKRRIPSVILLEHLAGRDCMDNGLTPELLERLLDQHGAALQLFAAQWTTTPEDCVQESFLQLMRQRKLPDRIVPWLFRVVRNQAISQRRTSVRRARHEAAAAVERPSWFSTGAEAFVDDERLSAALGSLTEDHREVIVAKIWGGLSFEQIAEVVGISRSSVHRRYELGLTILRERLEGKWINKTKAMGSTNSNAS
jgi:RNA polymerase sigma factor (sigma-70 family)